jgi:hypothetical protein
MKRPRIILIPVAILLAGLLLAMTGTLIAARPEVAATSVAATEVVAPNVPGAIEGYLYTPINTPVQGGWISVTRRAGLRLFATDAGRCLERTNNGR